MKTKASRLAASSRLRLSAAHGRQLGLDRENTLATGGFFSSVSLQKTFLQHTRGSRPMVRNWAASSAPQMHRTTRKSPPASQNTRVRTPSVNPHV